MVRTASRRYGHRKLGKNATFRLIFKSNTNLKVMTLRPRQTGDDWRKMIKTIAGGKFTIGKAH